MVGGEEGMVVGEEVVRGEVVVQKKKKEFIMVGGKEVVVGYQWLFCCYKKMEIHPNWQIGTPEF